MIMPKPPKKRYRTEVVINKFRSELERRLAEIKPRLKPTDRVRWLWGYADALEDIIKELDKK
jgi:predicted trehalose synthase